MGIKTGPFLRLLVGKTRDFNGMENRKERICTLFVHMVRESLYKNIFPIIYLRKYGNMSYDSSRQAGTKRREELRVELARKLTLWEGSSLLPKEFADDLIETVLRFYHDRISAEEDEVEVEPHGSRD